jgi:hypothetical protein
VDYPVTRLITSISLGIYPPKAQNLGTPSAPPLGNSGVTHAQVWLRPKQEKERLYKVYETVYKKGLDVLGLLCDVFITGYK